MKIFGFDPGRGERQYRERVGVVLQDTAVDGFLTVAETVELLGQGYPSPLPVGEALALVGLSEQRTTRVGKLSGGQRRRLDMAVGLAGDPDLLFLDEPTTGFDPSARADAWTTIRGLAARGTTILLTTHYMEEANALPLGLRSSLMGASPQRVPRLNCGAERRRQPSRSGWLRSCQLHRWERDGRMVHSSCALTTRRRLCIRSPHGPSPRAFASGISR